VKGDHVRKHLWTNSALALATAAVLCAALAQQNPAQAAKVTVRPAGPTARAASGDGFGDFIVRCFFNKNIAPQNPIDNPGSPHDDNLYDFFGNMAGGTSIFPGIQSGDYNVTGATMEQNQLTTPTNCQDTQDTAGYWVPSPYMVDSSPGGNPAPWQSTNGCSINCKATGANENFHMRVYYIPNSPGDQQIPDGTIMMTGFPNGCATVRMGFSPPDCSGTNYPVDPDIITYACGANTAAGFGTPVSAWPYNCNHYVNRDSDDSYSDGAVAMVRFPRCWDGSLTGNFPAPNTQSVGGLPAETVPGYVAPWIVYSTWNKYTGLKSRPANDFAYPDSNGKCPTGFTHPVVQLEERIHLLTYGANWGAPSSCLGDKGLNWNGPDNAENSTVQSPGPDSDGEVPSDATVMVSPGLFGPWKCVAVNAPNPTSGATTLSFACAHSGDLNCNIPLTSGPTGCSSMNGTCYVGAYQPTANPSYGWETLNGVYWQTWQEAQNTLDDPANGGFDHPGDVGTFGDVMEDCVNPAGGSKCPAFIVTSQQIPQQVFGNGSGAP